MVIRSVGFYQMAKIAVTPTIVLAEFILFRKTIFNKKVNIIEFLCQKQVKDTFGAISLYEHSFCSYPFTSLQIVSYRTSATYATPHVVLGQFKTCM